MFNIQQGLWVGALLLGLSAPCKAADATAPDDASWWAVHGQFTTVGQYHGAFTSPYAGVNSLDAGSVGNTTADATLFATALLWAGGELDVNPEIDQGFGLSNTVGMAGYPSGEAYKVGAGTPYFRLQRAYVRQLVDVSGGVGAGLQSNGQDHAHAPGRQVILTVGKFSVVDVFDTNALAHDPRGDFLNWSIIDAGAFDYAADAWGYTWGGSAEWVNPAWTLRGGLFNLSTVPNGKRLNHELQQYEALSELELPYRLGAQTGKLKILAYTNRGRMGSYRDAVQQAQATGAAPDTGLVRRFASRAGWALNIEHHLNDDVGLFARVSGNQGGQEAYEFTEINRSISAGLSVAGSSWLRPQDTVGVAMAFNGLSSAARAYFAAGGPGILIADGRLPHAGSEDIFESYYALCVREGIKLALDYQFVEHPAYNKDRGPVRIVGLRFHAEF